MTKNEADDALAAAILAHALAYGNARDGDMLNHYAVIAHWVQPIDNQTSYYTTHYHRESVPEHITEGLFRTAIQIVTAEAFNTDD